MSSIDSRVVDMKFNNAQFEQGASRTLSTLDKLKNALNFGGAAKGMDKINASASTSGLAGMAKAVDNISQRFSALGILGIATLVKIGTAASSTALNMVKNMSMKPIMDGFREYEIKMGSIQTILANTARDGTKLKDVNKALDQLNDYADRTIYNFGDMTRNIALFTNAGIGLKTSVAMIKGFSNEAAASGTNAERAAGAAYQLSQAMSNGVVTLMDWKSLTNAGMGSANMREGIIEVAKSMGTLEQAGVKSSDAQAHFNKTLEKGWLTSGVMSKYLKIMTGDYSKAEIKAMGFSSKVAAQLYDQAQAAQEAATKTRTLTQLMGQMAERAGSGWSESIQTVFGDFEAATALFSKWDARIGKMQDASSDARNKMLKEWADAGGRDNLVNSLDNAFKALMSVIKPVQQAFRELFPPMTGKQLANITKGIEEFTKGLILSKDAQSTLKTVATGVFAVFKIGAGAIGLFVSGLGQIFSIVGKVIGILFQLVSPVLTVLSAFAGTGEASSGIDGLFQKLQEMRDQGLKPILAFIENISDSLKGWQGSLDGVADMIRNAKPLEIIGQRIATVWNMITSTFGRVGTFLADMGRAIAGMAADFGGGFGGFLQAVGEGLKTAWQQIKTFFSQFAAMAGGSIGKIDWNLVLSAINTGILAVIVVQIVKFIKAFKGIGETFESIKGAFDQLTDTLKNMQSGVDPNAMIKIAVAIGLLAGSMYLLSQIKPDQLMTAAIGMGVAFAMLLTAMKIFDKIDPGGKGAAQMIFLSGAILILATAMKQMGSLNWEDLAKGVVGLGASMAILMGALAVMDKYSGNMAKTAIGLLLLSGAIMAMAAAVAIFAAIPTDNLIKGGIAFTLLLGVLTGFVAATKGGSSMIQVGAGMVLMSVGIGALVGVIALLGSMNLGMLAQGMLTLGIVIGGLVIAVNNLQNGLAGAAAMMVIALALNMLVAPIMALGVVPWGVVLQGVATLGITMALLVASANALQGAMPGVAAVLALAGAMMILSIAIKTLGSMDLGQILTALVGLGGALLIFGGLSALLAPLTPVMLAMAGAVALFGAGVLMVGGGLVLFSMGLAALGPAASIGAAGIQLLAAAVTPLIPQFVGFIALGAGLIVLGAGILTLGAAVVVLGGGLMLLAVGLTMVAASGLIGATAIVAVVNAITPLIWQVPQMLALGGAFAILGAGMAVLGAGAALVAVGVAAMAVSMLLVVGVGALVVSVLNNFKDSCSGLEPVAGQLQKAADGLNKFSDAATKVGSSMAQASSAFQSTISNMNQVANTASKVSATLSAMPKAVASAVSSAVTAFNRLKTTMNATVSAVGKSMASLKTAITKGATDANTASLKIVKVFTDLGTKIPQETSKVVSKVKSALSNMASSAGNSAEAVGRAINAGMVRGMSNSGAVAAAARAVALRALAAAKAALDIHSPSKEFERLGKYVNQGFAKGLMGSSSEMQTALQKMNDMLTSSYNNAVADVKSAEKKLRSLMKVSKKKRDYKAIRDAKAELALAKKLRTGTAAANKLLTTSLKDEKQALLDLGEVHDEVVARLDEAQRALDDAMRKRDDAAEQYRDQYSDLPEIAEDTLLSGYQDSLVKSIADTQKFYDLLKQLRAAGLNDIVYKELLGKGTSANSFMEDILNNGWGAIANLNELSSQLDSVATDIGKTGSTELYQAGVDVAQGLVDGIKSEESAIAKEMEKIADYMLKAIKKKLGIKSPSKEFAKIGGFSMSGLAKGLQSSSIQVDRAAEDAGKSAMDKLRDTLNTKSLADMAVLDLNPTIKPVLDLSDIRAGSAAMDSLLDGKSLAVATYSRASNIAQSNRASETSTANDSDDAAGVNFNQYNYSPKALSNAEIYRQTKNGLSTIKGALPA